MLIPALLVLGLLSFSTGEIRREFWPDGHPRTEYEVEVRADGSEVRNGRYRSWHENGALASEGSFLDDKETGRWKFFHASGERAAEGSFARGDRTGVWETFHLKGTRESKGRYEKNHRSGEWSYWTEDGAKNALDSGTYEYVQRAETNGCTAGGYLLDGELHGEWKSAWPDGATQLSGGFERGHREGPWVFHDQAGNPLPLLSGNYENGKRVGMPQVEAPGTVFALPPLEPGTLGWPAKTAEIEAELTNLLAMDDAKASDLRRRLERAGTRPGWMSAGQRAVPVVLKRLQACDPESAAGRTEIGRLDARVLRPLCGGHALGSLPVNGPDSAEDARQYVAAWSSLWRATKDDVWFWRIELPLSPTGNPDELLSEAPFLRAPFLVRPAQPPPALFARRFEPRGAGDGPLRAALEWLERNQLENGSWSPGNLPTGPEEETHAGWDVGVTSLALLALLGAGRTQLDSAVTNATGWLLEIQEHEDGRFRTAQRLHWMYGHAMATLALCEVFALRPSEILRPRLQSAVDLLFAARNPSAGWRYTVPPNGENDTSVTAWAVTALLTAKVAGLEGDFQEAFDGALALIDRMTESGTGTVGYDSQGGYPARTRFNEHYLREKGDPMTAAGLLVRRLLGQARDAPIVQKEIALLRSKPPLWDPDARVIDEYYFYYGAQAIATCGPVAEWDAGLRQIVRAQCINADERGSWDPVGVWSAYGGRVYSTALIALALESPFRYTLADQVERPQSDVDRKKEKKRK